MDRNGRRKLKQIQKLWSLSARRAWIEITAVFLFAGGVVVALRKESVDRNKPEVRDWFKLQRSLSARRAWIEMQTFDIDKKLRDVALRKESVDRNLRCCHAAGAVYVALRKESVDRNM